jgi:hypothetical protein
MAAFWTTPIGVKPEHRTGVLFLKLSIPLGIALALIAGVSNSLATLPQPASASAITSTILLAPFVVWIVAVPLGLLCGAMLAIPVSMLVQRKPLAPALAWVYAPAFVVALGVGWFNPFAAALATAVVMLIASVAARTLITDEAAYARA